MPKDDVDKLFEDLFGYNTDKEPDEAPQVPAPKATPTKDSDSPEALAKAAQAVHDAIEAHTGRRRPVDAWKPVAGEALGVSRLYQKRWDAVLAKGEEMGILAVDKDSLSFPILVATTPPSPEPEPVMPVVSEPEEYVERERPTIPDQKVLPENWNPPYHQDCGHLSYYRRKRKDEEGNETEETYCEACEKKYTPSWQHLKGEFLRPLPEKMRRTDEKVRMGGFPGYCCNDEGFYIGGVTNNCRYENPKDKSKWCPFHRKLGKFVGDA